MIKVIFYSEDGKGKEFNACFRSMATADRFENRYKYAGGFNRFAMDIYGETDENLPIIPCSLEGYRIVYKNLYLAGA